MKLKHKLIILFFLTFIFTVGNGCKTATVEEVKLLQKHSHLCHEEIHNKWKHYSKEEQETITDRYKAVNLWFKKFFEGK